MDVKYSITFKEFVNLCNEGKHFVGSGNPNASILLIGKESAIDQNDLKEGHWYTENADNWKSHIIAGTCETLSYEVNEGDPLRTGWGRNTWSKYQYLIDQVFNRKSDPFHVNFLKYAFTTEINDAPNLNTSTAEKSSIANRKQLFSQSSYIREFPVVILACSNYIRNCEGSWEINEIFDVQFDGHDLRKYNYSRGNTFWTHHSEDQKRIVIHTCQLSANVNNQLLEDMAQIIHNHLMQHHQSVLK